MSKTNWTADNIPDLSNRIAVVTGANTGLGKETARVMAGKNARVVMAVRDASKGEGAAAEILAEHPGASVRVMNLDLSDLESIKEFAQGYAKEYTQLHYLINNAGVMVPPYSKTRDGFELQFGTNHLGHFALTGRLLPLLKATPGARVVTVSSGAHNWGGIDFDDLNWEKREYKASRAYGDSKIANLYFVYELARKLKDDDIKVTAAHPGWTATDLQRTAKLFSFLNPFFAQRPKMGALPSLRAAVDPGAMSGDYYGPAGRIEMKGYPVKVTSNELSHDADIAKKLWEVSEKLTAVTY